MEQQPPLQAAAPSLGHAAVDGHSAPEPLATELCAPEELDAAPMRPMGREVLGPSQAVRLLEPLNRQTRDSAWPAPQMAARI
jgi:hypothetical protein